MVHGCADKCLIHIHNIQRGLCNPQPVPPLWFITKQHSSASFWSHLAVMCAPCRLCVHVVQYVVVVLQFITINTAVCETKICCYATSEAVCCVYCYCSPMLVFWVFCFLHLKQKHKSKCHVDIFKLKKYSQTEND